MSFFFRKFLLTNQILDFVGPQPPDGGGGGGGDPLGPRPTLLMMPVHAEVPDDSAPAKTDTSEHKIDGHTNID